MAKYLFPGIGELDSENLELHYSVDIILDGRKVQIDLNFDNSSIDVKYLDAVKQFIGNITDFDKRNRKYIETDYVDEDCDTVNSYIEHHLEEIDREELAKLIDFDNDILSPEIQLVNALKLVRVRLYPESENPYAVFDYTIGEELTQYLIVVNLEKDGQLESLSMES